MSHQLGFVSRGMVTEEGRIREAQARRKAVLVIADQADSALTFLRVIQQLGLEAELDELLQGNERLTILVTKARQELELLLDEEGPSVEVE